MKPWKPSMWKPFSKVTFLCVPAWVRRTLKHSRDRGLERWKVFIEFLPPPGFSSSHSLPGHMLGILRGWEAEWGGRLKTLSSVRSPMWSASCDSVAIPRPAWGSRGDWPKCLPEQESYATCHLPPSLCYSLERFLVISRAVPSFADGTGWNPPAVAGIARTRPIFSALTPRHLVSHWQAR